MWFCKRPDTVGRNKKACRSMSTAAHPPCLSRRLFTSGFAVAGSLLAAPGLHAQARGEFKPLEKTKLTLCVDGKSALGYLPLTIAQQLSYFTTEGLDVQVTDFADAGSAAQAVINGAADVCVGSFDRTMSLHSKNHKFKAFVLLGRTPQLAFGGSTRSTLPLQITELRSKKLGVTALDSTSSVMIKLLLQRAGLQGNDVSFLPVGTSVGAINALRSGQIDGLCSSEPVMTMLEQKGDIKIIHDARTLTGTLALFGGLVPSACLYASSDFIQKNPQTCQALTHAIVHSLKWLQTAGPGDIINTVPANYLLGDRALYLAAFNNIRESISLDGLIPEEGAAATLKALSRYDSSLLAANINAASTYTNEFARRAKARFRA